MMKLAFLSQSKCISNREIILPSSKSISNRVLIIRALSKRSFEIKALSDAKDTVMLDKLLNNLTSVMNSGDGGTTFRFLLAYLCTLSSSHTLTGSDAFCKRPVNTLVEALRDLGANIEYTRTEGMPPLQILPSNLRGGDVYVDASLSSQFISALMMIAPSLPGGLHIHFSKNAVSTPYLQMTSILMQYFGVSVSIDDFGIRIPEAVYQTRDYEVEADWSAAGFWYAWIACADSGSKLFLKCLKRSGLQGDELAVELFDKIGVKTNILDNGVEIVKQNRMSDNFVHADFISCPDLAQPFISALCGLRLKAHCTGLQTLIHKETNRLAALQIELEKTGAEIEITSSELFIHGYANHTMPLVFDTYHDHRMAMCLSPLVQRFSEITIRDPDVVVKSYPTYWEQLSMVCRVQMSSN